MPGLSVHLEPEKSVSQSYSQYTSILHASSCTIEKGKPRLEYINYQYIDGRGAHRGDQESIFIDKRWQGMTVGKHHTQKEKNK